MTLDAEIRRALDDLEGAHALRAPRVIDRARGPMVVIGGREFVSFASNDYLGVSQAPRLAEAAARAASEFGWGAGSSRLLAGTTVWHRRLEERVAEFKREEAALAFVSGTTANVGLLTALGDEETLIASDELNHASLIDGCRLSRARVECYRHADAEDAARALRGPARRKLLVTDALFGMDGELAPLPELGAVAEKAGATLVVDDAHGTGVLGAHGRGTVEHFGLEGRGIIQTGNLAKAAGACGGFVCGSESLRKLLVNRARAFIYTTAPPPAVAAAACVGLELVQQADEPRRRLRENVEYLAAQLGVRAQSPIVSLRLGSNERALAAGAALWERGLFVPAIRPPTVPEGTARLRISVTALHERAHLEALARAIIS
ncbi:MAG: 8-amino-7-oxononanoate synthase [Planctomycetes bacterium]|nr:8-amino-7-oxononanoate synthase [Planctomycetota bacterium]